MARAVREVMTQDLQTCPADATVVEAARVMRDTGIGDVIVLDEGGAVSGILTDRDIAIRTVAEGRDPASVRVDDVASHDLLTIEPDTDVERAAELMRQWAVRRLPVTQKGKPVGIVSLGDLAVEYDAGPTIADISAAPGDR